MEDQLVIKILRDRKLLTPEQIQSLVKEKEMAGGSYLEALERSAFLEKEVLAKIKQEISILVQEKPKDSRTFKEEKPKESKKKKEALKKGSSGFHGKESNPLLSGQEILCPGCKQSFFVPQRIIFLGKPLKCPLCPKIFRLNEVEEENLLEGDRKQAEKHTGSQKEEKHAPASSWYYENFEQETRLSLKPLAGKDSLPMKTHGFLHNQSAQENSKGQGSSLKLQDFILKRRDFPPLAPSLVVEKYKVLGPVGEGPHSLVVRAEQISMKREVVLKFLSRKIFATHEEKEAFLEHLSLWSSKNIPCLLPIIDWGRYKGCYYYAMPLVEGTNLKGYLELHKPLSLEKWCNILLKLIGILEGLHENSICHDNLKGTNVFLDFMDEIYLSDPLTPELRLRIQDSFLPPEYTKGTPKPTANVDIFSLGKMMEWAEPFLETPYPEAFQIILPKMQALNPIDRPSLQEVREFLEYILSSLLISKTSKGHPPQKKKVAKKEEKKQKEKNKPENWLVSFILVFLFFSLFGLFISLTLIILFSS